MYYITLLFDLQHNIFITLAQTRSHVGLLTVDAKNRLTLDNLSSHPWLTAEATPSTPLQTSCVLGREKGTASALKHTFHAFHKATKAGFALGDVSRAPLAKRRKIKREHSPYKPSTNAQGNGEQPVSRPNKLELVAHDADLASRT